MLQVCDQSVWGFCSGILQRVGCCHGLDVVSSPPQTIAPGVSMSVCGNVHARARVCEIEGVKKGGWEEEERGNSGGRMEGADKVISFHCCNPQPDRQQ